MAGKSAGFAIGIGIQDGASACLDAINKRIAALSAPAERFNKSLAKFGEVTGINRAAEGMQTLGDRALGAARAVERLAGPMVGITSAASLGGVAELSRRWAEAGNQISKTSGALNVPVSRLSALRGAARLAGSSADALDSSLKGLGDALATAQNKGGPLVPLLTKFGIAFPKVGEVARTGADALGDVAEAVTSLKDPHAQLNFLGQLGISDDLLPLLNKGRKGLDDYLATAQRTGGVMTAEMAENAKKMNASWVELAEAIEGVGNRIVNSWSGTATKIIDSTSHWIENNKTLADSYGKDASEALAAMALLAARKPALWILRALGWEPLVLGTIGELANQLPPADLQTGKNTTSLLTPGGIDSNTAAIIDPLGHARAMSSDDYTPPGEPWWHSFLPKRWFEPSGHPIAGSRANEGTGLDPATSARAKLVHDGLVTRGMDSNTAWGFAGNAVRESRADPHSQPGDMGAAHGTFMWRDSPDGGRRLTDYVNKWGHLPEQGTLDEQLDNVMYELNGKEAHAWNAIQRAGNSAGEKGAAVSEFYERPKDTAAEESRRWATSQALAGLYAGGGPGAAGANGHVQVDVHLHNAPPGTTATAVASGAVTAAPPRVETSMPLAR